MNDEEFDVLDELYFVISFNDLQKATDLKVDKLIRILKNIHRQGWLRILKDAENELEESAIDLDKKATEYYYLASKSGLMAHNS